MNNEKIGKLISASRKKMGFTQKDLAEQLGISVPTVSKWERGLGCPSVELLKPLANLLDMTVDELLSWEKETVQKNIETKIEKPKKITSHKIKRNIFLGGTFLCFISIITCLICDYVLNQTLSWSIVANFSTFFGWALIAPFLLLKKHRFLASYVILAILSLPLLFVIEWFLPVDPYVIYYGTPILLWSLAYLLLALILIRYTKVRDWYCIGILCIIAPFFNLTINSIIGSVEDVFSFINLISSIGLGLVLILIGSLVSKPKDKVKE